MKKLLIVLLLPLTTLAIDKTICGSDDRVPSSDPKVGRALEKKRSKAGCTVTMISNSCAISVGHCANTFNVIEFNTPPSTRRGIGHPVAKDIYSVQKGSVKYKSNGPGDDWAVMKIKRNSITGMYPGEAQGFYPLAKEVPALGTILSITGYGADTEPERKYAQQNTIGSLKGISGKVEVDFDRYEQRDAVIFHQVDTMGGNSGSSIINYETGEIIGVHSHGGCRSRSASTSNKGTSLLLHEKFKNAVNECLASE